MAAGSVGIEIIQRSRTVTEILHVFEVVFGFSFGSCTADISDFSGFVQHG